MDIGRRIRFTDGREVDKKRIFLGLAGVGAAVAAIALGLDYSQGERAGSIATSSSQAKTPVSPERLAQLPAREAIGKPRGQPFDARSWAPPAPPASKVAPAPPKPVAPPVQYRVAGQVSHDGVMEVVLAHGDRIFTVREGETLEDIYRIEAITPDAVTLVYLPLNERQQIPVAGLRLETAAPAAVAGSNAPARAPSAEPQTASRPAQLRWEGPKQVQAGANFEVTLKLTSVQPVRALPLQLSYDAKLLEAVAVRPGGLFVLVDNYAPDEAELGRFINEVETLRDPSHVRNHTVSGWRDLLERAGMRTTVDSDAAVTKLTTENWLERSQTPPDRADEVRRRLRTAPPGAVETFQITPTTFAVRKLILIGRS